MGFYEFIHFENIEKFQNKKQIFLKKKNGRKISTLYSLLPK